MLLNPVTGTMQVNSEEVAAYSKSTANSAPKNSVLPEDTVTLSPAAQAFQTQQKLAAAAAESSLSPAAQALQTEQKLAAAAAEANTLSPAARAQQTEQKLAASAATLWRSALALTSE